MSSGNHMVYGADKALSRGDCACGGSWEPIEWCEQHAEECFFGPNCAGDPFEKKPKESCPAFRLMLKCSKCGVRVEAQ